ncbi:MAG TPA: ATP-binding protein [Polyangiaceae bacterium]
MRPFAYIGSHLSRLSEALLPRRFESPDAARSSRLVVKVALITLCVSVLMQVQYHVDGAHVLARLGKVSIALQLLGLGLHRATGSYKVGAHLHCLAIWALFFGLAMNSGGIESPNLVANVFIVVLAPMMLGRRHGLFWLVAVSATYFGQFVLTSRGMVQQTLRPEDLGAMRLVELIMASATCGLTAYFFAKGEERMRGELAREKRFIEAANADLRVILDNAGQGFLSLDAEARVTGERSAIIDSWLSGVHGGVPFWELLRPLDARLAAVFEAGWMQVMDDGLPLELCLEQLPKRLVTATNHLSLEYRAVRASDAKVAKFVVIISDVSAELARQEAEVRQRDLLEAFERILRDPEGFSVFLKSARRDVREITSGTLVRGELKRCLHTLKGNSGMMGLSALAHVCHELENEIENEGLMSSERLAELARELASVESRLAHFVTAGEGDIVLRKHEYEQVLRAISAHKPHQELLRMARTWPESRVDRHLTRLSDYARQLAERLGKGKLEVEIEDGDLRMPEGFADFWDVAVHVVRNAVDHGIEAPMERSERGKGPGKLAFRASKGSSGSMVEVSDDGRGIDWERIRELARARGLPAESQPDLLAALLTDGLSTSSTVSEISGRGVGMSSVRKVCENLGIHTEALSTRGAGTTFRFVFPERPLAEAVRLASNTA